ncbi:hypothetical protein [Acinetobacter baumannii]|uniref:Uncharacterized protein n=1 Tax=Acinetobacter baumannii TaxID=470 RepID=A0A6A8BZ20_ACIBA|nr:hypothetical protein [Acinetobacter baumannii]CAH1091274.1 Uncharacterised protein [Acinetobacter phage MD-2021a]EKL8018205.1 hypothetical protein [Acinetobacter baumannii]EKU0802127.1 hypothetical protein [Acinetobacter baumannii]EKU1551288.1 hypothetical protein [Acinetobacter baumannii]EKU1714328.1 hypothetical protein [Acinetobacter baumannii]
MSDSVPSKQGKYAAKRKTKSIKFDMYLDDPVEKHMFETWQKEPYKKQLFIKLYAEHLAKKDNT